MAPYSPPVGMNYCHVKVADLSSQQITKLMGTHGKWFKDFTYTSNLEYVWYSHDNKWIELWGRHDKIEEARPTLEKHIENIKDECPVKP